MSNQNSKLIFALLAGAAVGAAIGFYFASDNKEEIVEDLKTMAGKVKEEMEADLEKGKQIVDELKGKFKDLVNKV